MIERGLLKLAEGALLGLICLSALAWLAAVAVLSGLAWLYEKVK